MKREFDLNLISNNEYETLSKYDLLVGDPNTLPVDLEVFDYNEYQETLEFLNGEVESCEEILANYDKAYKEFRILAGALDEDIERITNQLNYFRNEILTLQNAALRLE